MGEYFGAGGGDAEDCESCARCACAGPALDVTDFTSTRWSIAPCTTHLVAPCRSTRCTPCNEHSRTDLRSLFTAIHYIFPATTIIRLSASDELFVAATYATSSTHLDRVVVWISTDGTGKTELQYLVGWDGVEFEWVRRIVECGRVWVIWSDADAASAVADGPWIVRTAAATASTKVVLASSATASELVWRGTVTASIIVRSTRATSVIVRSADAASELVQRIAYATVTTDEHGQYGDGYGCFDTE